MNAFRAPQCWTLAVEMDACWLGPGNLCAAT
jgi:hypothetical protein